MKPLHLIVTIGGARVAMPTEMVESVVEIETLTPVPRAPAHVAGLAPLRSRVLTIIDCHAAIGLPPPAIRPAPLSAVVVNIDGHCYGLMVDTVEDVLPAVEARPAIGLSPGWARVTNGIVEHEGEAVLLVTVAALVAGPVAAAA
jgi:purine-binding chemotaxis protein CheW